MNLHLDSLGIPSLNIPNLLEEIRPHLVEKINHKTKPIGSLGRLEELAIQIGLIQNNLCPKINNPTLLIFAADHGIAKDGVSAYPQEVTYQMVLNFLGNGAAANVFSKLNGLDLKVIDAGINYEFNGLEGLIHKKIDKGTRSFLNEPAMSHSHVQECFLKGAEISFEAYRSDTNLLAFGEMGIANTSSSSLLSSILIKKPLDQLVGTGTGLDSIGLKKKFEILNHALNRFHQDFPNPSILDIFANFGGFEILMMAGAMLEAASLKMLVLVDGFISTAAYLCAYSLNPSIEQYAIFSHLSGELGHQYQLEFLKKIPLLNLGLRLGEGSGAILAFPILKAAISMINEMASFQSAGVSTQNL